MKATMAGCAFKRYCQVERKYAHRLKVADHRSVILGPQKRACWPIKPTRSFLSNAPILPQLDNAAGTVLDTNTARRCLDAGASFLTAPELYVDVVQFAIKENLAVLPGALTPIEVAAWRAGADFVKVFPCAPVGGDKYIKALHASLPQIPLIAAGGVSQQTAASYILSGAIAIGVGTELIPTEAIERHQLKRIQELALRFAGFVKEARDLVEEWQRSAPGQKFDATDKCEKP